MKSYRKKPVVIQAIQVPDRGVEPTQELIDLVNEQNWEANDEGIIIPTLEGNMLADPLDWIIKGVKGEYYPCKPEIFILSYDEVE